MALPIKIGFIWDKDPSDSPYLRLTILTEFMNIGSEREGEVYPSRTEEWFVQTSSPSPEIRSWSCGTRSDICSSGPILYISFSISYSVCFRITIIHDEIDKLDSHIYGHEPIKFFFFYFEWVLNTTNRRFHNGLSRRGRNHNIGSRHITAYNSNIWRHGTDPNRAQPPRSPVMHLYEMSEMLIFISDVKNSVDLSDIRVSKFG